MSQDIREEILAALDVRFKGILQANGYRTDLGLGVYPWLKYRNAEPGEKIIFSYRDPRRQGANAGGEASLGEESFVLELELQAIVEDDDDETTTAHDIIRDLRKAVGIDPTFGGGADRTKWISDEIETELGETVTSFVNVTMQVFYTALEWSD